MTIDVVLKFPFLFYEEYFFHECPPAVSSAFSLFRWKNVRPNRTFYGKNLSLNRLPGPGSRDPRDPGSLVCLFPGIFVLIPAGTTWYQQQESFWQCLSVCPCCTCWLYCFWYFLTEKRLIDNTIVGHHLFLII